jgi:lipopolysaccharide transport protein LptA
VLVLAALWLAGAQAQLPPFPGPIQLEADSSEIDRKNSRLVFHNVRIRQDELGIRADTAEGSNLEFAEAEWVFRGAVAIDSAGAKLEAEQATLSFLGHRARRAELEGAPVTFEQIRPGASEPTRGHAARIEYDFDAKVLTLRGNAWLAEGHNEISGDNITYEIGDQRVTAGGDEHGERVRITIVPPPETPAAPPEPTP